jgi:hypothetical protein
MIERVRLLVQGFLLLHRRNEAIAAAGHIHDVAVARLTIAKRLAQGCNVYPQARLFHECVRPDASDQLLLGDELSGALDQGHQDFQRAAPQPQRLAGLQQSTPEWQKLKRPKC